MHLSPNQLLFYLLFVLIENSPFGAKFSKFFNTFFFDLMKIVQQSDNLCFLRNQIGIKQQLILIVQFLGSVNRFQQYFLLVLNFFDHFQANVFWVWDTQALYCGCVFGLIIRGFSFVKLLDCEFSFTFAAYVAWDLLFLQVFHYLVRVGEVRFDLVLNTLFFILFLQLSLLLFFQLFLFLIYPILAHNSIDLLE